MCREVSGIMDEWEKMDGGAFTASWFGQHVWWLPKYEGYVLACPVGNDPWCLHVQRKGGGVMRIATYFRNKNLPEQPFQWANKIIAERNTPIERVWRWLHKGVTA